MPDYKPRLNVRVVNRTAINVGRSPRQVTRKQIGYDPTDHDDRPPPTDPAEVSHWIAGGSGIPRDRNDRIKNFSGAGSIPEQTMFVSLGCLSRRPA